MSPKYNCHQLTCVLCGSNQENSTVLYRFPKSPERKQKWIDILRIDKSSLKARSRVCERHFGKDQKRRIHLIKGALPTSGSTVTGKECKFDKSPLKSRSPLRLINILPRPPQQQPQLSAGGISGNRTLLLPLADAVRTSAEPVPVNLNVVFRNNKRVHSHCQRKISTLKVTLKKTREKSNRKVHFQKLFESNPLLRKTIESQMQRLQNGNKIYTEFERGLALSLYYSCGTNGYRMLRTILKLPDIRTLRLWTEKFHFSPGISKELLETIQSVTSCFSSIDRDCILTWDEMAIKEILEYNRATDKIEGIVDLGSEGRKLECANEALVFMVQGISSKWKFPVSFYFSNHATKTENLDALVRENLEKLLSIGLNVRMFVCDMAFTNQSLYRKWEISQEKPFKILNDRKIYCVHDTPHLIKLVRNNLMKYDFFLLKRAGKNWVKERIRWLHLVNFFSKDRRMTTRMAPKLTTCHIFLKDFSKMKVKLATQLLSKTVFAGMMAMINLKILKPEVKHTATFVKMMDEMFDLLNMSKYSQDKESRCARLLFKSFHRFDEVLSYLNSIEIPKYPHKTPEFLSGLKVSVSGIKMICLDLKNEGYDCVYTRQLQQDCLENFFSAIRMKGGFCRNPSANQFRSNFKYLFLAKLLKNPVTANTEGDFHEINDIMHKIQAINPSKSLEEINVEVVPEAELPIQFYPRTSKRKLKFGSEQEKSVLSYFAPACVSSVVSKLKCHQCAGLLYNIDDGKVSNLVTMMKVVGGKSMSALDKDTFNVFLYLNQNYDQFANESLNSAGIGVTQGILDKFLKQTLIIEWVNGKCEAHKLEILQYFIRAKLYRKLKDKNENVKKIKCWDQTRRELRNQ